MSKYAHIAAFGKACKPITADNRGQAYRRDDVVDHDTITATQARAGATQRNATQRNSASESNATASSMSSPPSLPRCAGVACRSSGAIGGGMGDTTEQTGGGKEPTGGGVTHKRRSSLVVSNESGRGVWGLGEVLDVIPAGYAPYYFCKRRGLPLGLFGKNVEAVSYDRYVVMGDDGRVHVPRRVNFVNGQICEKGGIG